MTIPIRQMAVALVIAMACQPPGHTQGYAEGPLLVTDAGPHFSNSLLHKGSFEWFGVFIEDGKTRLRKTRVRVEPYKSKTREEFESWDLNVQVEGPPPLLLIDRIEMRGNFPVTGAQIEFGREPGAMHEVIIGEDRYTLHFPEDYDDQLEIIKGRKTQMIHCPGYCPVIWVGDLDGDSKLDFITDPSGGGGGGKRLFLSTPKDDNDLVFPAGFFWDQNG